MVVGCPSGWDEATKNTYKALLAEAGLENISLVAESRAALIHAKESLDIKLSHESLATSILLIDLGSSTTDFTVVHGFLERELNFHDFGDNHLGAGLIEGLLAQYSLRQHLQKTEIERIFAKHPAYAALFELRCRQLKEKYFRFEQRFQYESLEDSFKLPTSPPILIDIRLDKKIMEEILALPLAAHPKGWKASFLANLKAAREELKDDLPKVIILTGGASRMNFVHELCQQHFPQSTLIRGKEPELAIAKGLAWAGRIDKKVTAFEAQMDELLASDHLYQVVNSQMPLLLAGLARSVVETLPQVMIPPFQDWQAGRLENLVQMEDEMAKATQNYLQTETGQKALKPAVDAWLKHLRPSLEIELYPLCDRYGIPRSAFELNTAESFETRLPEELAKLSPEKLWRLENLSNVASVIISMFIARVVASGALALVLKGPLGWLLGLVLGFILSVIGRQAAETWAKQANIPLWARALASGEGLKKRLYDRREELESKIVEAFLSKPDMIKRLSQDIADSIKQHYRSLIDELSLLIR
ncbi:MAG: Hsp70 family protein [Deinococcales bacterium]